MRPLGWFSHLRVRLLILIGLAVLPGAVVNFSTAARWRQHETEDARADALRLARHAATLHSRMVEDSRAALFGLARLAASCRGNDGQLRLLLQACLVEHRSYESLAIVGLDGRAAIQVGGPQDAPEVPEPFFRRAIDTHSFAVGAYRIDPRRARAAGRQNRAAERL